MSKNKASTSISNALKTLDNWQLSQAEKSALLGINSHVELSKIKMTNEVHERCNLIHAIDGSLKICFSSPENVFGYMTMKNHNKPFLGSRPVDLACKSIEGLRMVDEEIAKLIII